MYKPDEDIDNLGRDAAERYNPPGAPSWDALEKVLNAELPVEEEKKRRGFFFFFLLLLGLSVAGTAIWYGVSNSNKQTLATNKPANTEMQADNNAAVQGKNNGEKEILNAEKNNTLEKDNANKEENLESNKTSSNKTTTAANNNGNAETSTKNSNSTAAITKSKVENNNTPAKNIVANNAVASLKPVNKASAKNKLLPVLNSKPNTTDNNKPGTVANPNTSNAKRKNQKANQYQLSTTDGQDINNQTVAAVGRPNKNKSKGNKGNKTGANNVNPPLAANGNDDKSVDTQNASNSNGNDLTTETASNKPKETPISVAQDSSVTNNTIKPITPAIDTTAVVKKDSTQKKKNKTNREKALLFGLTGGFDYSTVKFTYGENAGYNIGVMAGYQFSKHWSVYTGAVYTKKNYKLAGKDYNPPQHYFTRYVDLQTVDGYCRMWEIPLQARYTFNPAAKTAFFANAGLSSYFMTKQAYSYSYKDTWGQTLSSSWATDSTFNHVFSILHLSAGFQKPLGRHMNWQIEPYAKIPLGGVGFGNIRLSSFGINFSVQYRRSVKR